jgi:hypothetical protein
MVRIFDEDGHLDLDAAARELDGTRALTNSTAATKTIDILKTAALLDIAVSLRILSDSVAIDRMTGFPYPAPDGDTATGDEPREADEPIDLLRADRGTPVRTIPPEGVAVRFGTLTGNAGESEGLPWVGVMWEGHADEARVFTARLEVVPVAERVHIDAAANADVDRQLDEAADTWGGGYHVEDAGAITDADLAPGIPSVAEVNDDEDDDIDADFDAPADALAALKAKKAKGKGGKK